MCSTRTWKSSGANLQLWRRSDEVIKIANNMVKAVKLARILSWRNQWARPGAPGIQRMRTLSTWSQLSTFLLFKNCQHYGIQLGHCTHAPEVERSNHTEARHKWLSLCSSLFELCCKLVLSGERSFWRKSWARLPKDLSHVKGRVVNLAKNRAAEFHIWWMVEFGWSLGLTKSEGNKMTSWVHEELMNSVPILAIAQQDVKVKKIGERCSLDLMIRKKDSADIPFAN